MKDCKNHKNCKNCKNCKKCEKCGSKNLKLIYGGLKYRSYYKCKDCGHYNPSLEKEVKQ